MKKVSTVLFFVALLAYCYFYFTRHDHFLDWTITSSLESVPFTVDSLIKGPFKLNLVGHKYLVEENFFGSGVRDTSTIIWPLVILTWLGVAYLLAASTSLNRFSYLVINAAMVLFIVDLNLESIGVFGFQSPSKLGTSLVILMVLGPGYAFHAFYTHINLWVRTLLFVVILGLLGTYLTLTHDHFLTYIVGASTFGFSILTFLFVFLIAEELIFGILYLTTQSQAKGNHRHFLVFSLAYLAFVTLYLLNKTGIYRNSFDFADPFLLLILSAGLSVWSLKFKQEVFAGGFGTNLDIRHILFSLGLVAFGWLSIGFVGGNDPQYESFHYLIIYAHVAFGGLFFLYIVANFIDALIAGHSVYKIVYRERNFPYATARLVGFIGVMAFFFLANYEPYELVRAAKYNHQGDLAVAQEDFLLAEQYFMEGSIFGYHNHYSNYQLAQMAQGKGDLTEAFLRYEASTRRYPTSQSFANAAALAAGSNTSRAITILRSSELQFPANAESQNNLANLYMAQGQYLQAEKMLEQELSTGTWNQAPKVNAWKLRTLKPWENGNQQVAIPEASNDAVQANAIAYFLGKHKPEYVDSLVLQRYNLHGLALLNNASYLGTTVATGHYQAAVGATFNPQLQQHLRLARCFNAYVRGDINTTLLVLEEMIANAEAITKGELLNLKGLIWLQNGIYEEAVRSFRMAQAQGFAFAALHEAIALLENRQWGDARIIWADLVRQDSTYAPYLEMVESVLNEEDDDGSFADIYYRWPAYEVARLEAFLATHDSGDEKVNLWKKIALETVLAWDSVAYGKYLEVFRPYLDPTSIKEAEKTLMVLRDEVTDQSFSTTNALDISATMGAFRQRQMTEPLEAYQLLIEAINIYPSCALYHQHYALLALELGLTDYAKDALEKLRSLLSEGDFNQFEAVFEAKLSSREAPF